VALGVGEEPVAVFPAACFATLHCSVRERREPRHCPAAAAFQVIFFFFFFSFLFFFFLHRGDLLIESGFQ